MTMFDLHCVIDHWVELTHCTIFIKRRFLGKEKKVKDDNARAYLLVKPHCHDGEDEGGVYEVREGDGKDERSGCLGEIEDVGISDQ